MKKTLLTTVALAALASSSALAADIPARVTKAPAMVPVWTWTGFYAGLNAGYGWARTSSGGFSQNLNGFVGGGQIGYNWQSGGFVFGIEADLQGTSQKASGTFIVVAPAPTGAVLATAEEKLPWFGTLRLRGGAAFDRSLLYVTGGVGWANVKLSGCAAGVCVSDDDTKFAWTVGAGWEYMFAPRWSGKLEYLYLDTGSTSITLFGTNISGRLRDHIVRVGVNYHFAP